MKTIYSVKFSKWFVSGNLIHTMFDDCLTFPTLETAASYVSFLHSHRDIPVKAIEGNDYTCHLARIETVSVSDENLDSCLKVGRSNG